MSPDEFRDIQDAAGLSDRQLAAYLGCSEQQVRRYKMQPTRTGHRPILPETESKMIGLGRR
jgi:hypothetical protein